MNIRAKKILPGVMSLIGLGVLAIWFSFYPYYPIRHFIFFSVLLTLLGALALKGPVLGLCGLLLMGPFFGNHPGGRYIEVMDLACLVTGSISVRYWTEVILSPDAGRMSGRTRSFLIYSLFTLFGVTLASYLSAFALLESFEGYKVSPFHFFSSRDWLPHYSLKIALMNLTIFLLVGAAVMEAKGKETLRYTLGTTIFASILIPAFIGTLEATIPGVADALDKYHIGLSGYVDRAEFHVSGVSWLSPALNTGTNSLFWNRSWFAVFLVSSLPLIGIGLHLLYGSPRLGEPGDTLLPDGFKLRPALIGSILLLLTVTYMILTTGARAAAGAIGLFWVCTLFFLFKKARRGVHLRFALWSVAAFTFTLPFLSLLAGAGNFLGDRAELYRSGLTLLLVFPLTGAGFESFGFWNDLILRGLGFQRIYSSSHNFLLQIATGMGLVGIIAILGLYRKSFRSVLTRIAATGHGQNRISLLWIFSGLLAVIFYGSFQEWWYLRIVHLHWWLTLLWPIVFFYPEEKAVPVGKIKERIIVALPGTKRLPLFIAAASLVTIYSVYQGLMVRFDFILFENVGHLEKVESDNQSHTTSWRYAILQGDGSYSIRSDSGSIQRDFECDENPELTGPPDPRRICRYEYLTEDQILEAK